MFWLYNIGIRLYYLLIYIASFFNAKAKLWIRGRKNQSFIRMPGSFWFHFASLGEFEQGRPVLEKLRIRHPERRIVITFFSPSGYEIRKNTPLADAVYYLPLDTAYNARTFINAVQPAMAVFTKYEYWYHFYDELHTHKIPVYLVSGIFRPEQIYFKWYGGFNRSILRFVTHFFVQDDRSKELLSSIGINNVTVSGDTRFDRVWENALFPKELPEIAKFLNDHRAFICGSTWPDDERLLAQLTSAHPEVKFIIAPHEISDEKINRLITLLPPDSTILHSMLADGHNGESKQTLVIDNIGMLSSLYQFGYIAYIGGGFGAGIHNTLEAAAFGLPVIFGPNYLKFKEAHDLIQMDAGFSIKNVDELQAVAETLFTDAEFYKQSSANAKAYVDDKKGATDKIVTLIDRA